MDYAERQELREKIAKILGRPIWRRTVLWEILTPALLGAAVIVAAVFARAPTGLDKLTAPIDTADHAIQNAEPSADVEKDPPP
ncbi:MAG: hypothetical protein O7A03_00340 [Alphaproteobacteria bacterium]|nr:hypothetical protein [Alphaproteobacteria bacterium]